MQKEPRLFGPHIKDYASWAQVYRSVDAFAPLVRLVLDRHGLRHDRIDTFQDGNNAAIFRAGEVVVKLLPPQEAGFYRENKLGLEIMGARHALSCGVRAPRVLFFGEVDAGYRFSYMVMDYCEGTLARDGIGTMGKGERRQFAGAVQTMTRRINVPFSGGGIGCSMAGYKTNAGWAQYDPALAASIEGLLHAMDIPACVFVHGDITGTNLIIGADGQLSLLDFESCHTAPFFYEWPPLAIELFGCDGELMAAYFGDTLADAFLHPYIAALAIHDYGDQYVGYYCEMTRTAPQAIHGVEDIKRMIRKHHGSQGGMLP